MAIKAMEKVDRERVVRWMIEKEKRVKGEGLEDVN